MKVKELINVLEKCDQETDVRVIADDVRRPKYAISYGKVEASADGVIFALIEDFAESMPDMNTESGISYCGNKMAKRKDERRFRVEGITLYYGDAKIGRIDESNISKWIGKPPRVEVKMVLDPSIEWEDEQWWQK